jgi:hypothetical protein
MLTPDSRDKLKSMSLNQPIQAASSEGCSAITKSGRPCQAAAVHGTRFCALHADPARAAELGRMGGLKNRHYVDNDAVTIAAPTTPEDVKNLLAQAMVDVRAKRLDPRTASTLTYMSGVLLKAFESTDLEKRLVHLEEKELRTKADNS